MPTLVWAVLAFGLMIFFHELGHFLMAKRVGIIVHAFALGFGPRLLSFTREETMYQLNLLPFGGYVRMAGEDFDDEGGEGSYRHKTVWQRMAVVGAGPAMNLMLAVLLLSLVAATMGIPTGVSRRVGSLMPGWPAERAGLRPGDEIVAVDGRKIASGEEVVRTIHRSAGRELVLTVRRGATEWEVRVTPRLDQGRGVGLIGFRPEPIRQRFGAAEALVWGLRVTGSMVGRIFPAIAGLLREGRFLEQLGGPVAAGKVLSDSARESGEDFLYTAAILSIMIGIFNLLPFPALDGGRLAFLLVEAVRRRPVDPKREGYVHLVGFALLLLLMAVLTMRDIGRL